VLSQVNTMAIMADAFVRELFSRKDYQTNATLRDNRAVTTKANDIDRTSQWRA
jgi:hypothetical protein